MREREMLTVITRRRGVERHGGGGVGWGVTQELNPTKKGCMSTVCAYALQKQACEMSHGCDMSLVQLAPSYFSVQSA